MATRVTDPSTTTNGGPTQPTLRGLDRVRIKKTDLIDIVKTNRNDHRKIFEEACVGWRESVEEALEEALDMAKKGRIPPLHFDLQMPIDQTKEYDQAIKMLELSQDDEFELTNNDFRCYVMDQWGWTRGFNRQAMMYGSQTATAKFVGENATYDDTDIGDPMPGTTGTTK